LLQHRNFLREFNGRSENEQSFLCINGFWPENAGDILPHRLEFTVRGIKTIVITQWADEDGLLPLTGEQKANPAL
jgi:hypothetical protein